MAFSSNPLEEPGQVTDEVHVMYCMYVCVCLCLVRQGSAAERARLIISETVLPCLGGRMGVRSHRLVWACRSEPTFARGCRLGSRTILTIPALLRVWRMSL